MSVIASQITSLTIVYSTVYSGVDQRKHESSASLAFVRGIHRSPVNSPHKGQWRRKCFHLMPSSGFMSLLPKCHKNHAPRCEKIHIRSGNNFALTLSLRSGYLVINMHHSDLVITGSGLPYSAKPLPEPMFTYRLLNIKEHNEILFKN